MGTAITVSHCRRKCLVVVGPSNRAAIRERKSIALAGPIYWLCSHRHPRHPVFCPANKLWSSRPISPILRRLFQRLCPVLPRESAGSGDSAVGKPLVHFRDLSVLASRLATHFAAEGASRDPGDIRMCDGVPDAGRDTDGRPGVCRVFVVSGCSGAHDDREYFLDHLSLCAQFHRRTIPVC